MTSTSKHTGELIFANVRGTYTVSTRTGNPLIEFQACSAEGSAGYDELIHLFASAPSLLSALELVVSRGVSNLTPADFRAIHAAIAEARGQETTGGGVK